MTALTILKMKCGALQRTSLITVWVKYLQIKDRMNQPHQRSTHMLLVQLQSWLSIRSKLPLMNWSVQWLLHAKWLLNSRLIYAKITGAQFYPHSFSTQKIIWHSDLEPLCLKLLEMVVVQRLPLSSVWLPFHHVRMQISFQRGRPTQMITITLDQSSSFWTLSY